MNKIGFAIVAIVFVLFASCGSKKEGDPKLERELAGKWITEKTERYTEDGMSSKGVGTVEYSFDASEHEVKLKTIVKTYAEGVYLMTMTAEMSGDWYAQDDELVIIWEKDIDLKVKSSMLSESEKREVVKEIESDMKSEYKKTKGREEYNIIKITDDKLILEDEDDEMELTRP